MKRRTIRRLKEIKAEQELSISKIMEMMESRGQYVSEATLKKVFADGSEDKPFRYQDSIMPIADVLLDIYGDKSGIEDVASLREIIREKNKSIEALLVKLEEQKGVYASKDELYQDRKSIYEKHIAQLEDQIAKLQASIDRKDAMIENLVEAILRIKGE